jgi:thiol-disulfide isomerase/thioredoxin
MKQIQTIPIAHPLALAVALVLLALPAAAGAQSAGQGQVSLPIGTPAPAVMLEDLDGNAVDLQALVRGKPAVIEFWATWCEQCEALQPEIDRVQARYGDRVQVVAVAVAVAQTQRRVRQHIEQHNIDYPVLWDARGNAVRAYQAATTAIIVILDADGKVAYTGVGPRQSLVAEVERLLGR